MDMDVYVCSFSVFILYYVGRSLAGGQSPERIVLSDIYKQDSETQYTRFWITFIRGATQEEERPWHKNHCNPPPKKGVPSN
jgi:hypothetical protein